MARGKSTGPDGIPMEFYQSFEKLVTPHLAEVFHERDRAPPTAATTLSTGSSSRPKLLLCYIVVVLECYYVT